MSLREQLQKNAKENPRNVISREPTLAEVFEKRISDLEKYVNELAQSQNDVVEKLNSTKTETSKAEPAKRKTKTEDKPQ